MNMKKNLIILFGLLFFVQTLSAQNIPLDWEVGMADTREATPENFYPAVVPGAVHLDYMKDEAIKSEQNK